VGAGWFVTNNLGKTIGWKVVGKREGKEEKRKERKVALWSFVRLGSRKKFLLWVD